MTDPGAANVPTYQGLAMSCELGSFTQPEAAVGAAELTAYARQLLVCRPLRQAERVLGHPRTSPRRSITGAIALARRLDPEKGIHVRQSGLRGGTLAQGAAVRIAPLLVRRGAESVATRVD